MVLPLGRFLSTPLDRSGSGSYELDSSGEYIVPWAWPADRVKPEIPCADPGFRTERRGLWRLPLIAARLNPSLRAKRYQQLYMHYPRPAASLYHYFGPRSRNIPLEYVLLLLYFRLQLPILRAL